MDLGVYLRIALLLVAAPFLISLVGVARQRFRRERRKHVPWERAPEIVRETVAPAALELAALGFELTAPVELSPLEVTDEDATTVYQLHDPSRATWAYLGVSGATRARPTLLWLETFTAGPDGRPLLLLSEGAHSMPALAESDALHVVSSPRGRDVGTLVASHRAAAASDPLVLDAVEALELGARCRSTWIERALASGRLVTDGEHFRCSLLGALRMAAWARYRSGVYQAHTAEVVAGMKEPPPPPELEATRHLQLDAVERRSVPRSLAALLFVLGAGLSVAWFSSSDPVLGLALLLVILFHELGHALAMRLLGYGDTRIYIIPGFGGAAVGSKRDASIHVEGVVLLAGPLPGLALGLLLAFGIAQVPADLVPPTLESLREPALALALAAIFVNYVNLLPALPLDGGRLAHRIVGGLHPWLDVGMRLLSIALLAAGALGVGDVLLGILAIAIALQTPSAYRAAVLERDLRAAGAEAWPERERIAETYRRITLPGATRRRTLATQVLLRLAAPDAPWWARLLWSGIYVCTLVGPLVLILALAVAFALAGGPPMGDAAVVSP